MSITVEYSEAGQRCIEHLAETLNMEVPQTVDVLSMIGYAQITGHADKEVAEHVETLQQAYGIGILVSVFRDLGYDIQTIPSEEEQGSGGDEK